MKFTYTITKTIDPTVELFIDELNCFCQDYGYDDLDDMINQNAFDTIKQIIEEIFHDYYEQDYDYMTSPQVHEFNELMFLEMMKGKTLQIPLDI